MTEKDLSLSQALSYAKVDELPAKAEPGANDWLKAVVLVRKANNRENYAIASNDGMGNPQITTDFGAPMVIREVLSVHPYVFRTGINKPDFYSKDDVLEYLVQNGEDRNKMAALMSDTYANGRKKPEGKANADREKIKVLVDKHCLENMNKDDREREAAAEAMKMCENVFGGGDVEDGQPVGGTAKSDEDEF